MVYLMGLRGGRDFVGPADPPLRLAAGDFIEAPALREQRCDT